MMKQRFQALLYIIAVMAAVQITGCRSNSMDNVGENTGGILPPSSVSAQITTAGEAGSTNLTSDTPVVHITWNNPEYAAAEFTLQLEYKKSTETEYTSLDVGVATSHVISNIDETLDYNIRMKATTEDGEVSEYAMATAYAGGGGGGGDGTCPVAIGVAASVISQSNVQVTWVWNSSDYALMTEYTIQRKIQSATVWTSISTETGFGTPAVSFNDTEPLGGPIMYRIATLCEGSYSYSQATSAVTAYTNLSTPTGLSTPIYYSSTVEYLDWANYTGGNYNVANGYIGFEIKYSVANGPFQYHAVPSSNTHVYFTPIGCADNLVASYQVRALAYNGPLFNSNWSDPIQAFCP